MSRRAGFRGSLFFYRLLLRGYPQSFRRRFGPSMEADFLQMLEDQSGPRAWLRVFGDLAVSIPRERARGRAPKRDPRWQSLAGELRYAARGLFDAPAFTAVAVVTLALGIGANSAIFTVVDSVLLRPLPYERPEQLVMIWESNVERGIDRNLVTQASFLDWEEQNETFEAMGAFTSFPVTVSGDGEPERLPAISVTQKFLDVLRVRPAHGRLFLDSDHETGAPYVALSSHELWTSRFGADPGAVGRTIRIDGDVVTIVGVLPPSFRLVMSDADLWVPRRFDSDDRQNRKAHMLRVVARRRPGVSLDEARADMTTIAARLSEDHPEWMTGWSVNVVSLHDDLVGQERTRLLVLLGAVALVLLIACVNVANLLLARASSRERETAIRVAMGARRSQLLKQFLVESTLLALVGGALGMSLAFYGLDALLSLAPGELPRASEIHMGWRVVAFTTSVSLAVGFVFGVLPGLRASRADLVSRLKDGSASAGNARERVRSGLVIAEVALSLVLLAGAGLLLNSFWRLLQVDPGFNPDGALAVSLYLPPSRYPEIQKQEQFYGELEEKLRAIPSVRAVGATTSLPLNKNESTRSFLVEGRAAPAPGERTPLPYRAVSPDYFRATGIALLKGRAFDERDRAESTPVLVINETMARRIWPDEDPLGRRIAFAEDGPWHEVVGVVADTKHYGLDEPARGAMYAPSLQRTWRWMSWRTFVLRTSQAPLALLPRVRNELRLADEELPIYAVDTLDAQVSGSMAASRFSLIILGAFAAAALALASIGIYGVIAFAVGLRSREMGLRMALGASRANVLSLVVGQAMKNVALGLAVGLVGAVLLTRFLSSSLYGVEPTDATTLLLATIVLATVALGAVYWPARRATRVDPMLALRHE